MGLSAWVAHAAAGGRSHPCSSWQRLLRVAQPVEVQVRVGAVSAQVRERRAGGLVLSAKAVGGVVLTGVQGQGPGGGQTGVPGPGPR